MHSSKMLEEAWTIVLLIAQQRHAAFQRASISQDHST